MLSFVCKVPFEVERKTYIFETDTVFNRKNEDRQGGMQESHVVSHILSYTPSERTDHLSN